MEKLEEFRKLGLSDKTLKMLQRNFCYRTQYKAV